MTKSIRSIAFLVLIGIASLPGAIVAQGAEIAFGGLKQDPSLPVDIAADQLSVSQADGTATFKGNVIIGQGEMRLSAGTVLVKYKANAAPTGAGQISRLVASDGVTLVNGGEAAEAQQADYSIDDGTIVMTGDVVLTQGRNAMSAQKLTVDLKKGTGLMEGRVRTVLQTDGN